MLCAQSIPRPKGDADEQPRPRASMLCTCFIYLLLAPTGASRGLERHVDAGDVEHPIRDGLGINGAEQAELPASMETQTPAGSLSALCMSACALLSRLWGGSSVSIARTRGRGCRVGAS